MGQQQLLLIILGVIIVGIAIAVGVSQFSGNSAQSNKDGVMSSLQNIAANAYQYKIRPTTLGGGGNAYTGYTIPSKLITDQNANYTVVTSSANSVQLQGTSTMNTAWVATCTSDDSGKTVVTFNGW
jgi:hypothetical protein